MNKYPRIAQVVFETPWAILEAKFEQVMRFLSSKFQGEEQELTEEVVAARLGYKTGGPSPQIVGSVAIVPVFGVLSPRVNLLSDISGATSTERLANHIREFAESPQISSIVLDVNSPGGTVGMIPEAAEEIRQAREKKPVVAVANGIAASAAYWLAASASELVVTPSGQVGSIGVFLPHTDYSRFYDSKGIKVTLISAGKYKTEGNPYETLSEEARANMQKLVNDVYEMFVKDVAKGRDVSLAKVRNEFGKGRMFLAKDAKAAGMVDRVATMNETIARMLRRSDKNRGPRGELMTVRDLESFLRDEGRFSNARAKHIASLAHAEQLVGDAPETEAVDTADKGEEDSRRDGGDDEKAILEALESMANSLKAPTQNTQEG